MKFNSTFFVYIFMIFHHLYISQNHPACPSSVRGGTRRSELSSTVRNNFSPEADTAILEKNNKVSF